MDLEVDAVWATLERGGFGRSEAVQTQVDEMMPCGRQLIQARALGQIWPSKSIEAGELQNLPTPIREADYLCFGVATAGSKIDERARALCEAGELIDSMILDAIAMTGLSLVGDQLGNAVFGWADELEVSASRAFSPGAGAGDWELSNQRFIFDHLPEEPLGIRLTPQYLMQPSKSISFVIGIGKNVKQAKYPFSCEGCDLIDCEYRYVPSDEMVGEGAA